jgi:hypothetical protein
MQITALLPSICFEFTIMTMGFGSNGPLFYTSFTVTEGFITLGIMSFVYFVLFIYLSLVLPNENGNNLHPLFFLQCLCEDKRPEVKEYSLELTNLSSARYH